MIVIDEIITADLQRRRPLRPGFGERIANPGPRAFESRPVREPELISLRNLGLIFEYQIIARVCMENRGIDDVIAGVEENLRTSETLKVFRKGAVDPVAIRSFSDAGPNNEPSLPLCIPINLRRPGMDRTGNVRHHRKFTLGRPMHQIARFGVSDFAFVPSPCPDGVKFLVRPARNEDIPHQLTLILRLQDRVPAVYGVPMISVGTQRIVNARFCRLNKISKQKVIFC